MTPASASTNDANRASLCWPPRPDIAAPPREQCRTYGFVPALSRRPCDSVRLEALFNSPLFTGCQSEEKLHLPGNLQIRDHRYWLPLVMLYSGARPGEITQMHTKDVRL